MEVYYITASIYKGHSDNLPAHVIIPVPALHSRNASEYGKVNLQISFTKTWPLVYKQMNTCYGLTLLF